MIPLIGILLCVYLVFKGLEIFQIAYSNAEAPTGAIVIGVIAVFVSIALAATFAFMFIAAGASIPGMPTR